MLQYNENDMIMFLVNAGIILDVLILKNTYTKSLENYHYIKKC